jgi:transcriptional regulator with XRE-family HTH domain
VDCAGQRISQSVFALYLNVRPKLVSEWERGEKKPSGPSLKLLSIVKSKGLDAISFAGGDRPARSAHRPSDPRGGAAAASRR